MDYATKADVKSLSELIHNVLDKISSLEKGLGERLEKIEGRVFKLEEKNHSLTSKVCELEEEVENLKRTNNSLKIDTKRRSKEYNLLFHGIKPVGPKETATQSATMVSNFLRENLAMDSQFVNNILLAHAHRLHSMTEEPGNKNARSSKQSAEKELVPPIVVKFVKMADKLTILETAADAKNYNVGITQHLPVAMQRQRRKLLDTATRLYNQGKKIKWKIIDSDYCLFVDNRRFDPNQK